MSPVGAEGWCRPVEVLPGPVDVLLRDALVQRVDQVLQVLGGVAVLLERVGVEGMTCHVAEIFVPSLLVLLRLLEYVDRTGVGRGAGVPDRNIADNRPILQTTRLKNVNTKLPFTSVWEDPVGRELLLGVDTRKFFDYSGI